MVAIYVELIKRGLRKVEDEPLTWREQVKEVLDAA